MTAVNEVTITLTAWEADCLVHRSDLLEVLIEAKDRRGCNWQGMLAAQPEHTSGGSAGDRKCIVQAMAKIEIALHEPRVQQFRKCDSCQRELPVYKRIGQVFHFCRDCVHSKKDRQVLDNFMKGEVID